MGRVRTGVYGERTAYHVTSGTGRVGRSGKGRAEQGGAGNALALRGYQNPAFAGFPDCCRVTKLLQGYSPKIQD